MASTKAPAGGTVSQVNGQFYNGGEFIPDTGLYCGKGRGRVSVAKFTQAAEKARNAGYVLRYSDTRGRFELSRLVKLSNGETTEQVFIHACSLATIEKCTN